MGTRIQFIILVTFACIICNISAQELIGRYLENLTKNMAILNKEKNNKQADDDYLDDDYYFDDVKEEYKPPPPPPTKGSGRSKPSKDTEHYAKGSDVAGSGKKHGGPKKDEAVNPRPSADKGVGFRVAADPDGPETLNVLTVKRFMFQAQPVTPAGRKVSTTRKIYYYT